VCESEIVCAASFQRENSVFSADPATMMLRAVLAVCVLIGSAAAAPDAADTIVQLDDLRLQAERHSKRASIADNVASVQVEGKITALPQSPPPLAVDTQVEPNPIVTATVPPVLSWYGGADVTIMGDHLGTSDRVGVQITVDGKPCKNSRWVSRKKVVCNGLPKVPIHMQAAVVVTVGGDADSEPFYVGIGPQVVATAPTDAPSFGGFWLDVQGHNFGLSAERLRPPVVFVDDVPCKETQWKSESLLKCLTPELDAGMKEVKAVVHGHASNATKGAQILFEEPEIVDVYPKAGPAYGGAWITVVGKHLGLRFGPVAMEPVVLVNEVPCDRVERSPDNTTHVRCLLPTGHKLTAGDAVVEAKLGKRSVAKSPDGLFTLEEMKVTKVVPAKSDLFTPRAGVAIVIKGTQLAVEGMPDPTVTIDGTPCGSVSVRSTFDGPKGTGARERRDIHCVVPTEKGLGGTETFTVVNGEGHADGVFEFTNTPTVTGLKVPNRAMNAPAPVGYKGPVEIHGTNFGVDGQPFATRLGLFLCENPERTSYGVTCTITGKKHPDNDGSGGTEVKLWPTWHKDMSKEEAGVESINKIPKSLPIIDSVEPTELQNCGGQKFTLKGQNLGGGLFIPNILIGGQRCLKVRKVRRGHLTCETPANPVGPADVVVKLRGVVGTMEKAVVYKPPAVTSISPPGGAEYGHAELLIRGVGLGWIAGKSDTKAFIDGRPCYNTVIKSFNEVVCMTPPGEPGEKGAVIVMVNNVKSEGESAYAYDSIHSNRVVPGRGAAYGNTKVVIYGLNVGDKNNSKLQPTAYIGKVPCLKTTLLSADSVECLTPPGEVGVHPVSVKVNGKTSNDTEVTFEYLEPLISHVSPAIGGQFGGEHLVITGLYLGLDIAKPVVTVGGQVCLAPTVDIPGKKISCVVPVGSKVGKVDVVVTVNAVASKSSEFARYEYVDSVVNRVQPREGPTYGGTPLTLTGHLLGIHGRVPKVYVGTLQCTDVHLVSESQLTCTSPKGVTGEADVQVMYAGVYGSKAAAAFKFVGPEVSMVVPAAGATYGGMRVTVVGTSLGNERERPVVMVGGRGCTHLRRLSDKKLSCVVPPGSGVQKVVVTVGGQENDPQHVGNFTYEDPKITAVLPKEGPPAGGNMIMIQGLGLKGGANMTTKVTVNGLKCEQVNALDAHRVTCVAPPSKISGEVPLSVMIGSTVVSGTYVYINPVVTSIEPEQIPNYGGAKITIRGRYFGVPANSESKDAIKASVGGVDCEKTTLISEVELECITPAGGGVDTTASVNVQFYDARSADNQLATFRAPFIKKILPSHVPRDAHARVEIEGRFLGNSNRLTHVMVGGEPCTDVKVDSDHLVSCLVPPGESGTVAVEVRAGQDVGVAKDMFRREDVSIRVKSVTPKHISFWIPHTVTVVLKTTGIHPTTQMNVTFGGHKCDNHGYLPQPVEEIPNSEFDKRTVTCTTPVFKGPDGPGKVHVKAAFKDNFGVAHSAESNATTIDISAPTTTITPESLAFYGNERVSFRQLEGDADSMSKISTLDVKIGTKECKELARVGDSYSCLAPTGVPGKVGVFVTRDRKQTARIGDVHYDGPLVRSVTPNVGPTFGETLIKIEGRHFGTEADGHKVAVYIGNKPCLNVNRTSTTTIECETPESDAADVEVAVSVRIEGVKSVVNSKFGYVGPNEKMIQPPMGPLYGGETIRIFGSGFGNEELKNSVTAFIGGTPCLETEWISSEEVECITPAGTEGPKNVSISVGKHLFQLKAQFHYQRAIVMHITPSSGPVYGGQVVTLDGMFLVPSSWIPKATLAVNISIGGSPCNDPELVGKPGNQKWQCTTSAGSGSSRHVSVLINGAGSNHTSRETYNFVPPTVTSVSPAVVPFFGDSLITLKGQFLGVPSMEDAPVVKIGKGVCTNVTVVSEGVLTCRTPMLKPRRRWPIMVSLVDLEKNVVLGKPFNGVEYALPKVRSAKPNVGPTYGGHAVLFTGMGMGSADLIASGTIEMSIGGNPCKSLVFVSEDSRDATSTVRCVLPAAEGDKFFEHVPVEVKVGDIAGSTDGVFGYRAPLVTQVEPASGAIYGGDTIIIRGKYLGAKSSNYQAIIGRQLCIKTEWLSESALTCLVPPASNPATRRYARNVIVTVNDHTDPENLENELFTYKRTKIVKVTPSRGPATGNAKIVITGSRMGTVRRQPTVSIGGFACAKTVFVSSTEVHCITPPSLFVGKSKVTVSVYGMKSNKLEYTYDGPHVFDVTPKHGPATGGNLLHIKGKNFGDPVEDKGVAVDIFVGNGTCMNVNRLSSTELTCVAPPGTAHDNEVRVHVGITKALSHENATYHYRIPFVQCIDRAHGELFGGDEINILGRDFGAANTRPLAFIGGVECTNTTFVSEHHLVCKLPPAAGRTDYMNKSVIVTSLDVTHPGERHAYHFIYSGGQNKIFSYDSMSLDGISHSSGPTYGHNRIRVTGKHIGTPESKAKPDVYIGEKKCLATYVISEDALECQVPPGTGTNLSVSLKYFDVNSMPSDIVYTYNPPQIHRVKGQEHGASYGGVTLTILGENLGDADDAVPEVRVGENKCQNVTVVDDKTIECETEPGTAANLTVSLSIFGVKNVKNDEKFLFTYEPPLIQDYVPDAGVPWYGNETLIIFGKYFGSETDIPSVTIGGVPCLSSKLISDEEIKCVVPPGRGEQEVVVTVKGTSNAKKSTIKYLPPVIHKLSPDYGPSYGNTTVVLIGERLIHPLHEKVGEAFDSEVTFGGEPCSKISKISPTRIVCEIPDGKQGRADVEVSAFGSISEQTNSSKFTYQPPKVITMLPSHGKFYGNTNLTLVGANFGNQFTKTQVTVGGVPCRNVKVYSQSMVRCQTPPGVSAHALVKVIVSGSSSSGHHVFKYDNSSNLAEFKFDPPRVASVFPLDGPATGHEEIIITGHLFGMKDDSIKPIALIGGKPCLKTTWVSETQLKCITPTATLSHEVVAKKEVIFPSTVGVIVRGMPSDPNVGIDEIAYGYHRPRVLSVSRCASLADTDCKGVAEGPAYGRTKIKVLGMGFGPGAQKNDILKPTVVIGGVPCETTEYVDDMQLFCITPPGRANRTVAVEIDGVLSVASHIEPTSFKYIPPIITGAYLEDPRVNNTVAAVFSNTSNTTVNETVSRAPKKLRRLPVYGGMRVYLVGDFLGERASDMPVGTVGGRPCKETTWVSNRLIICVTPAVKNGERRLGAMIGASVSPKSSAPKVKAVLPMIKSFLTKSGPELGGDKVEVVGRWLGGHGVPADEVVLTFGGIPCRKTEVVSSTKAICHTAPGFGTVGATIVVRGHSSEPYNVSDSLTGNITTPNLARQYTFVKLSVTGMSTPSGPTKGGAIRTILGQGIPSNGSIGLIGGKPCLKSMWVDSTRLDCAIPKGVGVNHTVEIKYGDESSALRGTDVKFSYDKPIVQKAEIEGPKGGNYWVNITGHNFGTNGSHPLVLLDGEPCLASKRVSHELVQCLVPPGAGKRSVDVDVLGRRATELGKFVYTPAKLLSVTGNAGPTKGGFKIVITGDGFGASPEEQAEAEAEGQKQLDAEKLEEKEAKDAEEKELDESKKAAGAVLGAAMAEDANAMARLKNQTASMKAEEARELDAENATATKERAAEQAEELAAVSEGIDNLKSLESGVAKEKKAEETSGSVALAAASDAKKRLTATLEEAKAKISAEETMEAASSEAVDPVKVANVSATKAEKMKKVTAELEKVAQEAKKVSVVSTDLADAGAVAPALLEVARNQHRRMRKSMHRDSESLQMLVPEDSVYDFRFKETAKGAVQVAAKKVLVAKKSPRVGVWVGNAKCLDIKWVSNTVVECIAPAGIGHAEITVRAPSDEGVKARGKKFFVNYDSPHVASATPSSGSNAGAFDVELVGKAFGVNASKVMKATIGGKPCLKTTWVSDSVIVCRVPPGAGANLPVLVSVRGTLGTGTATFTYDAPVVSSISPREGPAKGGVSMTIKGTSFGYKLRENLKKYPSNNQTNSSKVVVDVLFGTQQCKNVKVITDDEIKCVSPPTLGNVKVTVIVGGQRSVSATEASSGAASAPSGATGAEGPTGATGATGAAAVEPAMTGATGGAGEEESLAEDIFHTFPPSVKSVKPPYSEGEGGRILTLHGKNFGEKNNTMLTVRVGGELASEVQVVSDSVVRCKSPAGSGENVTVQAFVAGETNRSFDRFEYDPPLVYSASPKMAPAGKPLTISGANFGAMDHKIQAFVGDAPCKPVTRIGEDSIKCKIPVGVGKNIPVRVLVFGRKAPTPVDKNATFTYPPPAILSVIPRSAATHGGATVRIMGHGFGGKPNGNITAMIDSVPCDATYWVSDHAVDCVVPAGVGTNVSVQVYFGQGATTKPKNIFSYDHPAVLSVNPTHGPGSGDTGVLEVSVENIGDVMGTRQKVQVSAFTARLAAVNRSVTIGGKPCKILNVSEDMIRCVPPKGAGYDLPVVVTVEGISSPPTAFYTYDGPRVLSVVPNVIPTAGGVHIDVRGTSFGIDTKEAEMKVLVGGKVCEHIKWVNDTDLSCVAPAGMGSKREVVVIVKGQPSVDFFDFSYARPIVTSVTPGLGVPGARNVKLSIRGKNFGQHSSPVTAFIGKAPCTNALYVNSSLITCVLDVVRVGKFSVQVTVAGQTNRRNELFESSPPIITDVSPVNGPTRGGFTLTIRGENFIKNMHAAHIVTVGPWLCTDVLVKSDTELSCTAPKGISGVQNITVVVNNNPSAPNSEFMYNPPQVSAIKPSHGKMLGGTVIRITGKQFGGSRPAPGQLTAMVGGKKCQSTKWISDTEVECVAPEGAGACKAVQVRVGAVASQVSPANTLWHYEDPAESAKSYVVKLNPGNFDEIVNGDHPVLIKFCTRECEHCQALKPVYEEIARMLKCKNVVLASVRVDKHPSLAKKFNLKDFPRLLWFSEGRTTPTAEFQGKLVAENMLGWMANMMGITNNVNSDAVDATRPDGLADGLIDGNHQTGIKRCKKMQSVKVQ
jgi:large repetitive protein